MTTIYIDDVPYTVSRKEASAEDLLTMAHDEHADGFDIALIDDGVEVAFEWSPFEEGDRFVTKRKET